MSSLDYFGVHSLSSAERADGGLDLKGPGSLGLGSLGSATLGPITLEPGERLRRVRSLLEQHARLIVNPEDRDTFLEFLGFVDTPEEALGAVDLLADQVDDDLQDRIRALRTHVSAFVR